AWSPRSQRRVEPEKLRVDRPENRNARSRQCRVCRPCLRSGRFEDEPQNHRSDSDRNRADHPLNQNAPHVHPTLPVAPPPTDTHVPRRRRQQTCRLRQQSFRDCGKNRSDRFDRRGNCSPLGFVFPPGYPILIAWVGPATKRKKRPSLPKCYLFSSPPLQVVPIFP